MQWFKHYYSASYSVELSELIGKIGVEGYGHYWLFLELLTEKYDGESTTFELHFEEISRKIRIKYKKKLERVMKEFPKSSIRVSSLRENVYKIEAPILLELKSRDFKRARQERKLLVPKKKNKIKNKNKIKETKKFDFELAYLKYPRKEGRESGYIKFLKSVKNENDYINFTRSVNNYALRCKTNKTDKQYILKFNNFMDDWKDYIDIEIKGDDFVPVNLWK